MDSDRQSVPVRNPALAAPENRPVLGLSFVLVDGRSKPRLGSRRRFSSGSYVIPGLSAMDGGLYARASTPLPGTKHPAIPHPDVRSKTVDFGVAAGAGGPGPGPAGRPGAGAGGGPAAARPGP